jgi:hypothetical protein
VRKKWCQTEVVGDWTVLRCLEADEDYKSTNTTALTTEEILSAFKLTKFFKDLINSKTIAIYVVGSRAIGLNKLTSDLDLIVILDDQEIDVDGKSADIRLAYKGIPVHWKFYNYKKLFYIDAAENMLAIFRQQICYTKPIPVYLDNRGKKLNEYLIKNNSYLTTLGAKLTAVSYTNKLLQYKNRLIQKTDLKKPLYHLIMASEILSGSVDIDALYKVKFATLSDYEYLFSAGLISKFTHEIHKLATEAININYIELKTQTDEVNTAICNLINSYSA